MEAIRIKGRDPGMFPLAKYNEIYDPGVRNNCDTKSEES